MARAREQSKFVVVAALVANVCVAAVKVAAAVVTRSSAMLAEAIHSIVDTGDSGLILLGEARAKKPATPRHPFGHGKEVYFWSLVVAMLIFGAGCVVAAYQGVLRLISPHPLEHVGWSYAVLAASAVFEATSFVISLKGLGRYRRDRMPRASLAHTIREAKDPAIFAVVLEDSAALAGLAIAAGGVALSSALGTTAPDAIASILIAAILAAISWVLGRECWSLLIGERALPEMVAGICSIAKADPHIANVAAVKTMHVGPEDLIVAVELRFEPECNSDARLTAVRSIRDAVRARYSEIDELLIDADSFAEV
ncbi:MAG TPA: cation diffusion facilitator family transporter [Kofleriaceae bacterium]|jgi:cation diffusion facilitator family transporter|nr:cation diffusion facilitator family transporter [Kofleriaceae bacterium]